MKALQQFIPEFSLYKFIFVGTQCCCKLVIEMVIQGSTLQLLHPARSFGQ